MIHRVIGHIEEKNESKYLVPGPGNELLDKYEEFCKKIKNKIKTINGSKKFEYE